MKLLILLLLNNFALAEKIKTVDAFINKTQFCKEYGCARGETWPVKQGGNAIVFKTAIENPGVSIDGHEMNKKLKSISISFNTYEGKFDTKMLETFISSVANQKVDKKTFNKIVKAAKTQLKGRNENVPRNGQMFNVGYNLIRAGSILGTNIIYIEPEM